MNAYTTTNLPVLGGMLRRVVTGEADDGRSRVVLDGPPSDALAAYGLFEIWSEDLGSVLDPRDHRDRSTAPHRLSPRAHQVKTRWFVVTPSARDIADEKLRRAAQRSFAALDAAHELTDQQRHPFMHRTASLDVAVLLSGSASLVLDDGETKLSPGQVVIQRGTAHAWVAHDGPALFLAMLIGRDRALPPDQRLQMSAAPPSLLP